MMGHYSSPDTNDGALFLPLTPMMGHYSSPDTNDGALFLPLIPMMRHCLLPLTPMMGHYSSHWHQTFSAPTGHKDPISIVSQ
ncbi:unnamed protein product, partial [Staurois parvus]